MDPLYLALLILAIVIAYSIGIAKTKNKLKNDFYKVLNRNKKSSADSYYYLLKTTEGAKYLFTEEQLKVAEERAEKNYEDTI